MRGKKMLLSFFHLFVGIGAIFGGGAAMLNPYNPLGAPVELLKDSPFTSFLIPGLILFTILGIGNIFSSVVIFFKNRYQGYISSIFGWALVIWIVVQVIIIKEIHFIHVLFFFIGLIQAGLSATLLLKENLFPANLIISLIDRVNKSDKSIG